MTTRMNPYLTTDGNGKEMIAFYEKALKAVVLGVQTFGEMPQDPNHPMPEEAKDRVGHAYLKVGETNLMISDTFPGQPYQKGNNVTIAIVNDDVALSKEMFDALSDGGQVLMPFQETFWSPGYGMVVDKFGVGFQITTEKAQQS